MKTEDTLDHFDENTPEGWVVVGLYEYYLDAEFAASALRGNGIPASLISRNFNQSEGLAENHVLLVHSSQAERAKAIVQGTDSGGQAAGKLFLWIYGGGAVGALLLGLLSC